MKNKKKYLEPTIDIISIVCDEIISCSSTPVDPSKTKEYDQEIDWPW